MSGPRIAVWTRRRANAATGGLMLSVLSGLLPHLAATPGYAKRKKRCKKLGEPCLPDGKRTCCHKHTCGGPPEARFCCKQGGEPCKKSRDCCNLTCEQGSCALN